VSAQLRRIEEVLGGELFERSTDGVRATPRGTEVLRRARPILARLDGLGTRPPESAPPPVVRVRTFVLPFEVFLPLLGQLAPGVRFEVRSGGLADGLAAVAAGDADVYFGLWWHDDGALPDGVEVDEVVHERGWVLLPVGHRCAGEPLVQLRSLAGETWVSRPEPELHEALLRDCRRAGFEPDVQMRAVDDGALLAVVGAGSGVALTSPLADVSGNVVLRPCSDTQGHSWALAHRGGRVPRDLLRMLGDLVRWAYAFRARSNPDVLASLPAELLAAGFPAPYGVPDGS
jgi:DNA-binding transcriptional LysR family regulator